MAVNTEAIAKTYENKIYVSVKHENSTFPPLKTVLCILYPAKSFSSALKYCSQTEDWWSYEAMTIIWWLIRPTFWNSLQVLSVLWLMH